MNLNEMLDFFQRFPEPDYYADTDPVAKVFSKFALEQIQLGNWDNFNAILATPRFNSYCANDLYRSLTRIYGLTIHPKMKNNQEELYSNMFKGFSILLGSLSVDFSMLYEKYRHEYYYFTDEDSGFMESKKDYFKLVIQHCLKHHIYISALSIEAQNLLDEKLDIDFSDSIKEYINKSTNDSEMFSHIYITGDSVNNDTDSPEKYLIPVIFEERKKDNFVKKLFGIGTLFNYRKILRPKVIFIEDENSITSQDSEPFSYPKIFNTPYTYFRECVVFSNSIWDNIFTDEEIDLIVKEFYSYYNDIYQ